MFPRSSFGFSWCWILIVIYFGIKGFQTFEIRESKRVWIFYLVVGILIFMPTLQRIWAIPLFQIILTILYWMSFGTLEILPYFAGGSLLIVCGRSIWLPWKNGRVSGKGLEFLSSFFYFACFIIVGTTSWRSMKVIVIGGGTSGLMASVSAAMHGASGLIGENPL